MYEEGRQVVQMNVSTEMGKRGWNASDLARAAGIDVGTAGDFLNGSRWPQRSTQNKIEAVFGWSAGSIFRWERGLPQHYRDEDFPEETVGPESEDHRILLDIDEEVYADMDPITRKRAKAEAEALYYRLAQEARQRADER